MSYELGRLPRIGRPLRPHRSAPRSQGPVDAAGWRRLTNPQHLLKVFFDMCADQGPGAGCDGLSYKDFSIAEIGRVLRHVTKEIVRENYTPDPERLLRIRKPSGGTRELRLATIVDRVVLTALARECRGPLEALLSPTCYGNRRGWSRFDALTRLAWEIQAGLFVFLEEDIEGAFDHVPVSTVLGLLPQLIRDGRVLSLVHRILSANRETTVSVVGSLHPVGIAQGSALSPLLLELLLTLHLDRPLQAAVPDNPVLRYCDNIAAAVGTVSEGLELRERIAHNLGAIGMRLKASRGPVDLRRHGAHRRFLGFEVQLTQPERRIDFKIGGHSWSQLQDRLAKTLGQTNPLRIARQVAHSWIRAQAPAFEDVEHTAQTLTRMRLMVQQMGLGNTVVTNGLEETAAHALGQWRNALARGAETALRVPL